jgi:hypothetical protein
VSLQRKKQLGRNGKPLAAKPRAKGNRAELEVINLLKDNGWPHAHRQFQSGGQGGGDISEGPADVHLEVKHRERAAIWEWLEQARSEARPTQMPAVVFRRNRSQWYAAIPLDDLLELLRLRDDVQQPEREEKG